MSELDRIERLEAILAYEDPENPWVRVWFDRVRFPDGREGRYNRIVEGDGRPGVAILPIALDGRIGLARQARYAADAALWEIPRGYGEVDDPVEDARRELLEEAGLTPVGELVDLGTVWPNSAVLATSVRRFAARVDAAAPGGAGDGELPEFRWVPPAEVARSLADPGGETGIADALTAVAVLRAYLVGLLDLPRPAQS